MSLYRSNIIMGAPLCEKWIGIYLSNLPCLVQSRPLHIWKVQLPLSKLLERLGKNTTPVVVFRLFRRSRNGIYPFSVPSEKFSYFFMNFIQSIRESFRHEKIFSGRLAKVCAREMQKILFLKYKGKN